MRTPTGGRTRAANRAESGAGNPADVIGPWYTSGARNSPSDQDFRAPARLVPDRFPGPRPPAPAPAPDPRRRGPADHLDPARPDPGQEDLPSILPTNERYEREWHTAPKTSPCS